MKLKEIKLLKAKPKAELEALLPELEAKIKEKQLKNQPAGEIKYQIALIKTICNK